MLAYDIPININLNAGSEEEAEEIVKAFMKHAVNSTPFLERAINNWDFIIFTFEENNGTTSV